MAELQSAEVLEDVVARLPALRIADALARIKVVSNLAAAQRIAGEGMPQRPHDHACELNLERRTLPRRNMHLFNPDYRHEKFSLIQMGMLAEGINTDIVTPRLRRPLMSIDPMRVPETYLVNGHLKIMKLAYVSALGRCGIVEIDDGQATLDEPTSAALTIHDEDLLDRSRHFRSQPFADVREAWRVATAGVPYIDKPDDLSWVPDAATWWGVVETSLGQIEQNVSGNS